MPISDYIIFQNHHIVVANKPAGMPVQPDPTADMPLLTLLEQYCQTPLFLINRIDRPVSGLVLFAKSRADAEALNAQFRAQTIAKTYLAAVRAAPEPPQATLTHFLHKGKQHANTASIARMPSPHTERAVLHYTTIGCTPAYTFLKIDLETGKHHQIRAQLAAIGAPIKGDVKYGARRANPDRSIHLHAWKLSFLVPPLLHSTTFCAPPPADDPLWRAVRAFIHTP